MPIRFNIENAISDFKKMGGRTSFPKSLEFILKSIQNDKNINSVSRAAYLLATAKVESDYSLQRWEADYLCGKKGVAYDKKPCEKALKYYRSSDGKKDYYSLGVDSNGLPYFGRGLIQLTGKSNYDKYGKIIGVDLVKDADKALIPKNSYQIASEYLKNRTWKYLDKGNMYESRRSVNGGTKGLGEVNKEYERWIKVFNKENVNTRKVDRTLKQERNSMLLYSGIGVAVIGFAFSLWWFTRIKD